MIQQSRDNVYMHAFAGKPQCGCFIYFFKCLTVRVYFASGFLQPFVIWAGEFLSPSAPGDPFHWAGNSDLCCSQLVLPWGPYAHFFSSSGVYFSSGISFCICTGSPIEADAGCNGASKWNNRQIGQQQKKKKKAPDTLRCSWHQWE